MVFRDENLTPRRIAGVLVAFAGMVVAIGIDALRSFDIRSLAQIATLGGALSYAFAASWGRARLSDLAPEVSAMGMLTGATILLAPVAYLIDGPVPLPGLPVSYGAIGFVAIVGTALAYLLYYRILRVAGSGNTMLVTLIIPPVSILAGALVLEERLAPSAFAGFGLVALGLLILDGRLLAKFPGARIGGNG